MVAEVQSRREKQDFEFPGEAPVRKVWGAEYHFISIALSSGAQWSLEYFSMPLLPGPLWPGVVVPVRVPFMVQLELFDHLQNIFIIYL